MWCHLNPASFVVVDSDTKKTSNFALSSSGTLTGGTVVTWLSEGKGLCEMFTGSRQGYSFRKCLLDCKEDFCITLAFGGMSIDQIPCFEI